MVLLFLAATTLLLVQAVDAQTDPPATGDWDIWDDTVVENRTVQLRGDLKIRQTGSLTLRNVTLQFFSSGSGFYGILVMNRGTLVIEDLDGDGETTSDRSVVMRGNPSWPYSFNVHSYANLTIRASLVTGMGSQTFQAGLDIGADNASLVDSVFMNGGDYCVRLSEVNGSSVSGCTFLSGEVGLLVSWSTNVTVSNCVFSSNSVSGIHLRFSDNTTVLGCTSSLNGQQGVLVTKGVNNQFEDTHIWANGKGMVIDGAGHVSVVSCVVNETDFEGVSISKGSHNITFFRSEVFDCGRSGIEAEGVDNLTLWRSEFRDNEYFGVRLLNGSRSVFLNRTNVANNMYDGVHIGRAWDVHILQGLYHNNGYNGVFLIDVRNVTVEKAFMYNNTYDGLNCDSNVGLLIDNLSNQGNGYNGINLQAGSRDILIEFGNVNANARSGLGIDSAYNITVRLLTSRFNGDYGLRIEGGAADVRGSYIISNNTGGAVRVQNSHDVVIDSSSLVQDPSGGYLLYGRDCYDVWITNSTIDGNAHLISGANVSMVHCTFDDVAPDVDTTSWLKFMQFVAVEVLWPNHDPVPGAVVNATGKGGQVLAHGVTDLTGRTGYMIVLVETYVGDSVSYENPITFWARKDVEVARNETNILGRSTVQILLEDDIPPFAVAPDVYAELNHRATLNGTASHDNGQLVSWEWTFDDGVGTVVLEGRLVNWTFPVLGTFSGRLEVSDSGGLSNMTTFTIHVTDGTAPNAAAGANVTIDQGAWVPVDGTATTDNDSTLIATGTFVWRVIPETVGSGERTFSGPITTIPFPDMGVYRVELNATDQSGNWGLAFLWVTVLDTTAPQVDAGPDVEVDEGGEVLLEPLSVTDNDPAFDANVTAWWEVTGPDTDLTLDGLVLVFIAPRMGEFRATLHVTDAAGNEGTDSRLVTARDTLPPVVDIGIDRTVEVLTELTFDAIGVTDNDPDFPDGATYRWQLSGPQLDEEHTGNTITFTVPWVGEYEISLTVTDKAGNRGSASVTVTSIDSASPEFGDFVPAHTDNSETMDVTVTFVITDVGTGVDTQAVEMRTRSPSDDGWTEWQRVSITGGANVVEESMVLQFPEGDSQLQLRCWDLAGNGPVESDEHLIRVNSRPRVVVLSPAEGTTFGPHDQITLDASASSDVDEDELFFRWSSDRDGLLGTNATVRTPPLSDGIHKMTVIVSDGVTGHDVLVTVTITVLPVPSTVEPDDGIPWWALMAALLLILGTGFVVWDHVHKRQRPPPVDEADEWVESP